jgi:hypothetical protein
MSLRKVANQDEAVRLLARARPAGGRAAGPVARGAGDQGAPRRARRRAADGPGPAGRPELSPRRRRDSA